MSRSDYYRICLVVCSVGLLVAIKSIIALAVLTLMYAAFAIVAMIKE